MACACAAAFLLGIIVGFGHSAEPRASARVGRFAKRTFHLDGKATPLFWAYGLETEEHLREYKSFGFNVLHLDVPWPQSGDVEEVRGVLAHRMALVRAAQREGLAVIVGVETAPLQPRRSDEDTPTRIAPGVEVYTVGLRQWLDLITRNFASFPNVIGYATQHDPAPRLSLDDLGFREFLRSLWDTPAKVGARWQFAIDNWRDLTTALPATIEKTRKLPLSFASLDLATYQWFTTARMLGAWATELKRHDPQRLLFTGRLPDYKTLACVPASYDGIVPCAIPGEVEVDVIAHNPHAVDIARRGGQFAVVPCLMTAPNHVVREETLRRQGLWLKEAFLHGASGACFAQWNDLRGNTNARLRIRAAIDEVTQLGLSEQAPTPTSALLYEPFADGAVLARQGKDDALYGFLSGFSPDEPLALFHSLRRGSRYGQLDVIGVDSLPSYPVDRCGALLAPLALHLDSNMQAALAGYVFRGGTFVADLGVGSYQSNGQLDSLPDPLRELFGVAEITRWIRSDHNLVFVRPHPLFPSIEEWTQTAGNLESERTVGGMLGVTRLTADTLPFGVAVAEPRSMASRGQRRPLPTEYSCVSIHALGKGYGVYAPFRLWSNWMAGHDGFQEFHHDLLSRNAVLELLDYPGLFPDSMPNHLRSDSLGVAGAAFVGGYAFFNGSDRVQIARANAVGVGNCLLTHCDVTFAAEGAEARVRPPAQQLGVELFAGSQAEPPLVPMVKTLLQPGALTFCRFIPVRVSGQEGAASAQVEEYSMERIRFKAWAALTTTVTRNGRRPDPLKPLPITMRVVITGGDYRVEPNSRHLVEIKALDTNRVEKGFAVADERGVIKLERKGVGFRFNLEREPR